MQLKFAMAATLKYLHYQGHGHGGYRGPMPPTFCQCGARDFFKIDEKTIEGGSSKSSEK